MVLLFLFPASSLAEKIVVLDPGHGGKYTGTCGFSGNRTRYCERDANLSVGLKARELLKNSGIKVVMTRTNDTHFDPADQSADLKARMIVANNAVVNNNDNSLFISIHHNGSPTSPYVRGTETYYYDGVNFFQPDYPPDPMQMGYLSESKRIAEIIHPKLVSNLRTINRGIGNDQSFYVIRNAQMPAVLVEIGYMTNREEEALIKTSDFQQRGAQAIAAAAIEFFKVFEVHNSDGKVLKTFKKQADAISYASTLNVSATVFDKDKQTYIYSNSKYEVYHRTNGLLGGAPTERSAIDFADDWRNTRVVSMETGYTVWSNYLDKKYDVYVNNQLSASYYDFDYALASNQSKANVKIVNNGTNDVVWTNIGSVEVTKDVKQSKLSGKTRFETAIAISKDLYPNGFPQDKQEKTVILATGYQFADALSAGPLAGYFDKAPILLTHADQLDDIVKQEIVRLKAKKVVIIGGKAAVSIGAENTLKSMNLEVERISGPTRYETNLNILKKMGNLDGLFVAYGGNFPDALAVAPIAANHNWGILLAQKDEVVSTGLNLNGKDIVITGGTGAVSDTVKNQLKTRYPSSDIVRVSGADRYETNAKVLWYFNDLLKSNSVHVTTGKDFPDALAAASLSIGTNSPLILVGDSLNRNIETYLLEYGSENRVEKLDTIGGVVKDPFSKSIANKLK